MKQVIEEWPDDTSLIVMEEYVNDELDDEKKLTEEIETKLNDEDGLTPN